MGSRESNVCGRKIWFCVNRLLKVLCGFFLLFISSALTEALQVIIALEECFQYPFVDVIGVRGFCWVSGCYSFQNMTRDVFSDVAFQCKGVVNISLIGVCLKMSVGGTMNELCRDTHPITGSLHCPFDDSVHPEFTRNLG